MLMNIPSACHRFRQVLWCHPFLHNKNKKKPRMICLTHCFIKILIRKNVCSAQGTELEWQLISFFTYLQFPHWPRITMLNTPFKILISGSFYAVYCTSWNERRPFSSKYRLKMTLCFGFHSTTVSTLIKDYCAHCITARKAHRWMSNKKRTKIRSPL